MADIIGAFVQGRQAAAQEREHQQALEENKLRSMILKHQIAGLTIEDTLRKRALQEQNLQMMQGQPEADLPTESVTQRNLPSRSNAGGMTGLPDVVSSLIDARNGGGAGPSTMPAPAAQSQDLATNRTTRRAAMPISGVPEWGVPGVSIRPRSMEDIVRASIAQKAMEPFNLNRGQERFVGGQLVAKGGPPEETRIDLGKKAAAGDPQAKAALDAAFPQRNTANALTPEDVLLDGQPQKVMHDRQGNYFDLDKNPIRNAAGRIQRAPSAGTPTAVRNADQRDATALRDEYKLFAQTYRTQHPKPTSQEQLRYDNAMAQYNADTTGKTPKPAELTVAPAPPSFEKWKVMNAEERQGVIQDPAARITDAEMTKRAKATPATTTPKATASTKKFTSADVAGFLKGKPTGKRYVMTDGSVWDLFPDGQFSEVQQP